MSNKKTALPELKYAQFFIAIYLLFNILTNRNF